MDFKNKKVLIIGMARSGVAAAQLLVKLGANIYLYDSMSIESLSPDLRSNIDKLNYVDLFSKDPIAYIKDMDALIMSPGVPLDLPFIKEAYRLKKYIISEIELGYLFTEADFIAITGTNGKTTTTALTGEIFKNAGYNTYVLGNIGTPITQEVLKTKKGDVIVAETAALQLDTIDNYKPKGSAILNITEDHLNRYGTMENYIDAKSKIFQNQSEEDYCVLNFDNEIVRGLISSIKARIFWFSTTKQMKNGAYISNGNIVFSNNDLQEVICESDDVFIPGRHNLENALAATLLTKLYGIESSVIADTLKTFKGVEHRIEFVREVNGVTFINDSKGTNPDATINAIRAMKQPTVLILGGFDKNSDFKPLFNEFDNVKSIVLLGDTASRIKETAKDAGYKNYIMAEDFEDAVLKAFREANQNETVLLSPACASWDMFNNFEQRGECFKEIVRGL